MRARLVSGYIKLNDRRLVRLGEDEAGLSLLSYALGATFIIIPIAVTLAFAGLGAAEHANSDLGLLLDCGGNQADQATQQADSNAAFLRC